MTDIVEQLRDPKLDQDCLHRMVAADEIESLRQQLAECQARMQRDAAWLDEAADDIADPYAELKAAAKDPTKQIRCRNSKWFDVGGSWDWCFPPENYEIRDKPKPKKVVKYLCYEAPMFGRLTWIACGKEENLGWYRRPAFDKECEVENE